MNRPICIIESTQERQRIRWTQIATYQLDKPHTTSNSVTYFQFSIKVCFSTRLLFTASLLLLPENKQFPVATLNWPVALTFIRPWPTQGGPSRRISTTKVILLESHRSKTHNDTHTRARAHAADLLHYLDHHKVTSRTDEHAEQWWKWCVDLHRSSQWCTENKQN